MPWVYLILYLFFATGNVFKNTHLRLRKSLYIYIAVDKILYISIIYLFKQTIPYISLHHIYLYKINNYSKQNLKQIKYNLSYAFVILWDISLS